MSCGCANSGSAAGGASGPGPLLSGTLDDRFASPSGLAPIVPTAEESIGGDLFDLASLSAFPGGKWAALFFVVAVGYVLYESAKKGE